MDLTHKLSIDDLTKVKSKIKKIFMYRICGTGMGACACLLKEKGLHIEGADATFYPPMSDFLKSTGIKCYQLSEVTKEKLKEFDLIVVGNVVPRLSKDAELIESLGVPFTSFPEALGAFVLKDENVIGIAGTHGKTTTTYLMAQVFEKLGMDPGYFIGGVIEGRMPSKLGDGKYFFIESDEYDSAYFQKVSKFRFYCIDTLVLTSLEFDHADIFSSIEDIKNEFRAIIPQVTRSYILSKDYVASVELYNEFHELQNVKKWTLYGQKSECGPLNIKTQNGITSFDLVIDGKKESFQTNVVGEHNAMNLTTVILYAHQEGFKISEIKEAVKDLKLVKRRQEERGHYKGSLVIDDFAHHPRAVELTIDAIKQKYPQKKINVVLEPNSATARSDIFQEEFTSALAKADGVILAQPEKATTVKGHQNLNGRQIVESLNSQGVNSYLATNLQTLRIHVDTFANDESILLILSNGTCLGLWESSFTNEIS